MRPADALNPTIVARKAPPAAQLQIVFRGECLDGWEPEAVRRALAEALELDEQRTARLFSGRRVVLRRAVTPDSADELKQRFAGMGAVVHVEERPSRRLQAPTLPESGLRLAGTLGLGLVGVVLIALALGPGLRTLAGDDGSTAAPAAHNPTPAAAAPAGPAMPAPAAAQAQVPVTAHMPAHAPDAAPSAPLPDTLDAEMPADMPPEARLEFKHHYAHAPDHKAFAIASGGAHGWRSGAASENEAREQALAQCRRAARAPGASCRVINADDVWEE